MHGFLYYQVTCGQAAKASHTLPLEEGPRQVAVRRSLWSKLVTASFALTRRGRRIYRPPNQDGQADS